MNKDILNTITGIKDDVMKGKRTLKSISRECKIFEKQAHDELGKSIFARLSDCKTRKEFNIVLSNI